jgi:hypothetical protein
MTILNLNISYPDFQLGDVIDPQSFDLNNSEIVAKINEIKNVVNTITDGTTGAANVSLATIAPFASTKVQAFLQEMVTRLQATAAGVSGSDLVGTPTISGVTGTTVATQLASFKALLDVLTTNTTTALNTHKSSTDHDGRYYTEAEIDGKITVLNTADTTNATNLTTHKTSSDHDGRYFTEVELQSTTDNSSGADKIGATPIATSPSTVQGVLEWLKNQIDSVVVGTVPDSSITPAKLTFNAIDVPFAVATGTANTYAVTLSPIPTSYTDGMAVSVKINIDGNAASTINVNGLGAKGIKKSNGSDVTNLKANGIYTIRYNATTGNFILQGEGGGGTAVAGDILATKTATTDAGDVTGSMVNRGAVAITPSASSQTIAQGYHNGSGSVAAVTFTASNVRAGTTIAGTAGTMVDRGAMAISASSTAQTIPVGYHNGSGVVNAVTFDATKVLSGTTIAGTAGTMVNYSTDQFNPSLAGTSAQTLYMRPPAGYWNGALGLIQQDDDFIPANIKTGVDIFGVTGTMPIGRKYASGSTTSSSGSTTFVKYDNTNNSFYYIAVAGLTFQPTMIMWRTANAMSYFSSVASLSWSVTANINMETNGSLYYKVDGTGAYVNSTSFRMPCTYSEQGYSWWAWE